MGLFNSSNPSTFYDFSSLLSDFQTQWWNPALRRCLPFPLLEKRKCCKAIIKYDPANEMLDLYQVSELRIMF